MSYNSLHVPLDIGTWQCTLVPASDFYHGWSYRQRWDPFADRDTREKMERQIADDKRTFGRYFRPNYDLRSITGEAALDEIRRFLGDLLNVAHWNLPADNAGIECALKRAVVDRKLVPIVNRDWGANQRTYRPAPAPERWPQTGGGGWAPRVEPYGGAYGGPSAVVSTAPTLADEVASSAADDGGGFDWLGVAEAVAGGDGESDQAEDALADGDTSTPLSDAQPFEYSPDQVNGDSFDIAKTPNLGDPGSWYTNPGSGQMRLYGDDGKPVVDLDFDHVHNGLQPHAHNWNNGVRDGGDDVVPFSPWSP
ncbi:hypothetical protein AB3X91_30560 [Paraburkholderia sp. BR14263]|uniref:hypothetical protein n=1 Tax=unclassified Paraburkholderia TaxID=2615204 RepID=UPI0034CD76A2